MVAVIGMGLLIVAGLAVLVTLMVQRMSPATTPIASAPAAVMIPGAGATAFALDEPPGTHIVSLSLAADRLALQLSGGGSDRVVIVDLKGRVLGRVALSP